MPEIINTKVRGVTSEDEEEHPRQAIIKKFVRKDEVLLLEREKGNSYDKNAIAVYVAPDDDPWDEGEYKIGYISSDLAARLAPQMDSGCRITCAVLERTGGGSENYGVNITLGVYSLEEVKEHEAQKAVRKAALSAPVAEPVKPAEIPVVKPSFLGRLFTGKNKK